MFLVIRNPGVADPRAFTLLGVSTTRNAGQDGTIGTFGSGSKNSIALLMRNGIFPTVYCGNLRMEFGCKDLSVKGQGFNQAVVKYGGTDEEGSRRSGTEDLGFVIEWGVADWKNLRMAFREFVANAIDGAICAGHGYKAVEMEVVKEAPRAKAGYTTVVIPFTNPDLIRVYDDVDMLFLHFGPQQRFLGQRLIPKQGEADRHTRIYKKGVLVYECDQPSAFDYNLGDDLYLDESRNAHPTSVSYAVARALRNAASVEDLATVLRSVKDDNTLLESNLDANNLIGGSDQRKQAFQKAWAGVAGPKGVATHGNSALDTHIQHKGYHPVSMPAGWAAALGTYEVPTELTILSLNEQEGKIESEPTAEMLDMTERVWALLLKLNMTNGKEKPGVKGYHTIMEGGSMKLGFYIPGGTDIFLHEDLGPGNLMFATTLEEVAHYVTGCGDASRDLQDFLFNVITRMAYVPDAATTV